jgi:hypothetical protein
MTANTTPIFPLTPKVSWGTVTAANTAMNGTGTVSTVFTAGADGSRIDQIKVRGLGTNVATALRFFINNGSTNATVENNSLVHETTIAITTASNVAALVDNDITINKDGGARTEPPILYLPAGYKINVAIGTAVAAGLQITVWGADY